MYPTPSPQYVPEPRPDEAARKAVPFAPVTTFLIAVNIVVFVVQVALLGLPGGLRDIAFFNSAAGTHALLATGANYWLATIREGRYETLLTSCFVHAGLLHIGFNMVALRQVGPFVERAAGPARMLPLYLISGIVASFVSTFYHVMRGDADGVGVGASGAICGLIGAALVVGYRVQGRNSPVVRAMGGWLVTILLIGLVGGIDDAAHLGGAVAGAVIAALWRRGFTYSTARRWTVLALCALVLAGAGGRLILANLRLPGATQRFHERLAIADEAISRGDCPTGRVALESARRLEPDSPEVASQTVLLRVVCH